MLYVVSIKGENVNCHKCLLGNSTDVSLPWYYLFCVSIDDKANLSHQTILGLKYK